jgi:hypothetical protein
MTLSWIYKAGRLPAINSPFRTQFELQVQTYAWLRSQIFQARPVGAGVLIYINELSPSQDDMSELRTEIAHQESDVIPQNGSADYYALHGWQPGQPAPNPSFELPAAASLIRCRYCTALVQHAVTQIDSVISRIESTAFREHNSGNIPNNWKPCGGPEDCVACDFVHFCPAPAQLRAQLQQVPPPARTPPLAPG